MLHPPTISRQDHTSQITIMKKIHRLLPYDITWMYIFYSPLFLTPSSLPYRHISLLFIFNKREMNVGRSTGYINEVEIAGHPPKEKKNSKIKNKITLKKKKPTRLIHTPSEGRGWWVAPVFVAERQHSPVKAQSGAPKLLIVIVIIL